MKAWLGKIGNFFYRITDKRLYRYYLSGLVLLGIVFTLARCTDSTVRDENGMAGVYDDYRVEKEGEKESSKIQDLVEKYYLLYAKGDVDGLDPICHPISDREKSYIGFFSQYIDSYKNITAYSKRGLDDESFLVSVRMEIKFKDIHTAAPGLDFFYVRTDKDGDLYIDNAYSSFNTANGEDDMDPDITALIATFEQQDDVVTLQKEIQKKFNQAMLDDEDLSTFLNTTLSDATTKWSEGFNAQEKTREENKEEDEKNKSTVSVLQNTTVYSTASKDGQVLGKVKADDTLTKYADEGDFSRVEYHGQYGYIESKYLAAAPAGDKDKKDDNKDDKAEEKDKKDGEKAPSDGSVTVPGLDQGAQITLKETVRVRSEASESSSIAAVAYVSEPVTILENLSSGWTKVKTVNNTEGFVKTELLRQ